ncbi:MAG TPA: AMP-binding protein, partial [Longimicrobiaceae bacterium]
VDTDYVRLAPGDRVAQASSASFDALAFEAWGAWLNGATLVGIPQDVLLSPQGMRQALRDGEITTLYQTTALLNQLSSDEPDLFAPLREVLFGGQAADPESVRRVLAHGKPRRLLHMYGPTETTAWCSWEQVEELADDAATVSVGRPTGNARIYLLDAALQPVPAGIPGEAYVGGDGVVRGYLDRPALTAERFVPDPFSGQPGARMYRTGDRLRWCESAKVRRCESDAASHESDPTLALSHSRTFALEFLGRLDQQAKIRGFRIEPAEVESAIRTHPRVQESRVVAREDRPGDLRLVAYVVGDADFDELREHLRRILPEYMVPAAFVALEHLPLTPNGKLDVHALPAPEPDDERYVAPRNQAEEVLAEIWAEVLHLGHVGVHDGFFELGGHSLLAMRVVSRIREVFGVELPLRALFEQPTVAELVEVIEGLRGADAPPLPPIVPVERARPLPLSFAQERLWFIDRLQPGEAAYNTASALRLRGSLEAEALERALAEIVRRHQVLRTALPADQGRAAPRVEGPACFRMERIDLEAIPAEDREAEAAR